ncbi:unnamed protein product, partial [marine sediment metagenome]
MNSRKVRNYMLSILYLLLVIIFVSCGNSLEKEYEIAQNKNTVESYRQFIQNNPAGSLSDSARVIITTMKELARPIPVLYFGKKTLLKDLSGIRPFLVTYYLYGKPKTSTWAYEFKDEVLNNIFSYQLSMASMGITAVNITFILQQDSKKVELARDDFKVNSENYKIYRSEIAPVNNITSIEKGTIIIEITGSGSNFGLEHDTNTFIKIFKPVSTVSDSVLTDISNLYLYFLKKSKWGLNSDSFRVFKRQVDLVILNDLDA